MLYHNSLVVNLISSTAISATLEAHYVALLKSIEYKAKGCDCHDEQPEGKGTQHHDSG